MVNKYEKSITTDIPFEIKYTSNKDGLISCYLPEINSYFSAKNELDMKRKAHAFFKIWIKFFNEQNKP